MRNPFGLEGALPRHNHGPCEMCRIIAEEYPKPDEYRWDPARALPISEAASSLMEHIRDADPDEWAEISSRLDLLRVGLKQRERDLIRESASADKKLNAEEGGAVVGLSRYQFLARQDEFREALVSNVGRPAWWRRKLESLRDKRSREAAEGRG